MALRISGLLLIVSVFASRATAQESNLFPVSGMPWSITPGPDGAMWFLEKKPDRVGRVASSGVVTEFPFPASIALPRTPEQIVAGADGNLWLSEGGLCFGGSMWRVSPAGAFKEFPLPDSLVPTAVTRGPDGNVWFRAVACGLSNPLDGKIGRITPSGAILLFSLRLRERPRGDHHRTGRRALVHGSRDAPDRPDLSRRPGHRVFGR